MTTSVQSAQTLSQDRPGYYGQPMIKPPEWSDLIPTYFFTGGMAGASATLAFGGRLGKNDALARSMLFGAMAGTMVSGFCLIADLKRPERFMNMLRVFKPTSPMSVGVYIFSAFGGAVTMATLSEITGVLRPIGRIFEGVAALLGPAMSCYTAVLISDTVVPAWHYGRNSMPALFAATSAATAGGWGMLFTPALDAGAARRLAMLGGAAAPIAMSRLHDELGPRQNQAYETGEAAMFLKTAKILNIGGAVLATLGGKNEIVGKAAGAMLLLGGLAERFGIFRAGCTSAKDPSYTIDGQRSAPPERA